MRSALLIEYSLIEIGATRLLAHILMHLVSAAILFLVQTVQVRVGHDFADRLHRELHFAIADLSKLPIG